MADINARMVLRQGASTLWASINPVLQAGEVGYETDIKRFRIGDGVTPFVSLPIYAGIPSSAASKFPSVNSGATGLAFSTAAEFLALLGITATPAQISGGLVPAGTVIFHAGPVAPTGFLKANGAAVSRTTYAALWTAIGGTYGLGNGSTTFNLPDMRGLFARGLDEGRGFDPGRALGSFQDTTNLWHFHGFSGTSNLAGDHTHAFYGGFGVSGNVAGARSGTAQELGASENTAGPGYTTNFGGSGAQIAANNGWHSHTVSGNTHGVGDSESRPRNMALLACIKF